jgi:hypothetical protein
MATDARWTAAIARAEKSSGGAAEECGFGWVELPGVLMEDEDEVRGRPGELAEKRQSTELLGARSKQGSKEQVPSARCQQQRKKDRGRHSERAARHQYKKCASVSAFECRLRLLVCVCAGRLRPLSWLRRRLRARTLIVKLVISSAALVLWGGLAAIGRR